MPTGANYRITRTLDGATNLPYTKTLENTEANLSILKSELANLKTESVAELGSSLIDEEIDEHSVSGMENIYKEPPPVAISAGTINPANPGGSGKDRPSQQGFSESFSSHIR